MGCLGEASIQGYIPLHKAQNRFYLRFIANPQIAGAKEDSVSVEYKSLESFFIYLLHNSSVATLHLC
jgi:hypothetical protein